MAELIVVACHGPDWIGQCRESLSDHCPHVDAVFIDTGGDICHGANVAIRGGHPTGAYLWAVQQYATYDRFLFLQDSTTALEDPLPWFREQWPGGGAVAWQRFEMQWDNDEQRHAVEGRYPGVNPSHGIFGPIFYTDRASLDLLAAKKLLPDVPADRMSAQGSERAWAYALASAGLPVAGPQWNPSALLAGQAIGPLRKTFAGRP